MTGSALDLLIIGAGPGGYVAAIRAAQLGLRTAVVDEHPAAGGVCLRVGCIPSKALLESSQRLVAARGELAAHGGVAGEIGLDLQAMMKRKDRVVTTLTRGVSSLLKRNGIDRIQGRARVGGIDGELRTVVVAAGDAEQTLQARNVIVATGSRPASLPGIELDGDGIGTSTEALAYAEVPERLVVIGAGYIGLELSAVWNRLGSRVVVLEYLDRILPGADAEIAAAAAKIFARQGLDIRLGCRVLGAAVKDGKEAAGCVVEVEGQDPIECDRVLVAVGRTPISDGPGLEEAGVTVDEYGFIQVDERFATSAPGVFAIGDVIGGPQLAHKAEEEGMACVEGIAGGYVHIDYDAIPGIVYTEPEVASVGRTEEQLREAGTPYRKGTFPFRAIGRARAAGNLEGFVKILAHADTDAVLGVHILGNHAGDLIAEAVAAISFGASAEDLFRTSHAHPTLAEAIKEAALAVHGRAIHM
ncbi:MAG: dihydrolipoyl dehydrogenase [Acidobacteriota bacterium]|nr:dihydrolipoyl dehydrogenase [Acidobacteriota bacterium]